MSDDDDTVPATASEVAAALKDGDVDALVELAKTLQEKTGDREFVESKAIPAFVDLLSTGGSVGSRWIVPIRLAAETLH
jgi:inorganic triphosphatase YgiF